MIPTQYPPPSSPTDRLLLLEHVVLGIPGQPGPLTALDTRIKALEDHKSRMDRLLDRAAVIATGVRWAALALGFLLLTVAPDNIAAAIEKALKIIKLVPGV